MADLNRFLSASDVVNVVAVEVGLLPETDPYSSQDLSFLQLTRLLDIAGLEMMEMATWQVLNREFSFTTQDTDTGKYDLPEDFAYMNDQTQWERSQNIPLWGPLTGQTWQYLIGRDLVTETIYASFRLNENQFWLFPQPPAADLEIAFEYTSRNWVRYGADPNFSFRDHVEQGSDFILYEPMLITRLLKLKFLEAKGFDSSRALADFRVTMDGWIGKDKGAPILNAGRNRRAYPYLDPWRNLPDSGYGL